MLYMQINNIAVTFSNMDIEIENYQIRFTFFLLIGHILFWSLATLYLDQVFPNEFGVQKHPLFFIPYFNKKAATHQPLPSAAPLASVEPVEGVFLDMIEQKQTINVKNLVKRYDSGKLAVNDLSLQMFKNQIFVLLGHNGAGKTTTISMLTGLLKFTAGQAEIFGLDVNSDLKQIQQMMGVCP